KHHAVRSHPKHFDNPGSRADGSDAAAGVSRSGTGCNGDRDVTVTAVDYRITAIGEHHAVRSHPKHFDNPGSRAEGSDAAPGVSRSGTGCNGDRVVPAPPVPYPTLFRSKHHAVRSHPKHFDEPLSRADGKVGLVSRSDS